MFFLFIICTVIGYLLGSANTSLIVGKLYGTDVRQHGSGNAGLTNTLRVLGKSAAILVLLGDILKGVIACLIGYYITGDTLGVVVAGTGVILGHNWPVYFGFKGGKGVLTSAAVLFMMDWKIGLIALAAFAVVVALTRFVSLGSMIGAVLFPAVAALFGREPLFIGFSIFIAFLIIIRHKANIERILKGTESKLFKSRKKEQNG